MWLARQDLNLVQSDGGAPAFAHQRQHLSLAVGWSSARVYPAGCTLMWAGPLSPPLGLQNCLCHFLGARLGIATPLWSHAHTEKLGLASLLGGGEGQGGRGATELCLNARITPVTGATRDRDQCCLTLGSRRTKPRAASPQPPQEMSQAPLAWGFPYAENRPLRVRKEGL